MHTKILLFGYGDILKTLRYNWVNKRTTEAGEVKFDTEVEHNITTHHNGIFFK
jgi:hypothetical protein